MIYLLKMMMVDIIFRKHKNNNNYINIFSLTSSGLSMMKELDNAMSSDNMWRTIKVYLDVWNEYTILVNKQLVNSKCKYRL
jgi:hypothetical protein